MRPAQNNPPPTGFLLAVIVYCIVAIIAAVSI